MLRFLSKLSVKYKRVIKMANNRVLVIATVMLVLFSAANLLVMLRTHGYLGGSQVTNTPWPYSTPYPTTSPPRTRYPEPLYIRVDGYWDPDSGYGEIYCIELEERPLSLEFIWWLIKKTFKNALAVSEGGTNVEVEIRGLDGYLLKSYCESIGGGYWHVWVDVTDLAGRTVRVTAKLIDEQPGAYGIPEPVIVDELTTEITITP